MSDRELLPFSLDPKAERDRERKRMDRIVTIRVLLIEIGAAALILYVFWLVLNVANHGAN